MQICESYWNRLEQQRAPSTQSTTLSEASADKLIARAGLLRRRVEDVFSREACERYDNYVRACNELGTRGSEMRDWARRLLQHEDYEARETAAWLIGQLGSRGQLGEQIDTVIDQLAVVATRPHSDEGKETQANTADHLLYGLS